MNELSHTQFFKAQKAQEIEVKDIIAEVYHALTEKGYNPVNQIVGYVMSGDPTYITSHKGARSLVMKVERDEIIEEILADYINRNFENQ
ncbi:MAG: IreB family regulatory phosphoprotein [Lachnospiraceae bacterium]|nr:IreB family regulatory phosphoprotein [Lachnospiraceae bacterium]